MPRNLSVGSKSIWIMSLNILFVFFDVTNKVVEKDTGLPAVVSCLREFWFLVRILIKIDPSGANRVN